MQIEEVARPIPDTVSQKVVTARRDNTSLDTRGGVTQAFPVCILRMLG